MADEQTPPKRDVDEHLTLDASDPTSDHDGPLAHLLSSSPISDLEAPSPGDSVDPRFGGVEDEAPGADVGGPEDLRVTTAELPLGPPAGEPAPPAFPQGAADRTAVSGRRSFDGGEGLRFSTENRAGQAHSYPTPLVPHAVPAPIAPTKSVRVPGQERPRGALSTAVIEIAERPLVWASAGFFGLVVVVLLAAGNFLPNPFGADRTDVVADNPVPAAPASDEATETSESDTSSSTGAGTGRFDSTTSIESTTSSTAPPSTRAVVTTPRPTARSTTTVVRTSTTATSTSAPTSTTTVATSTTDSSSSSTTDTSESTTTDTTGSTTTDTTGGGSSTTEDETTTTTGGSTTGSTTGTSGSSGSSSRPATNP